MQTVDMGGDMAPDGNDSIKVPVGDSCAGPGECVTDALCVGNPQGEFRCMATCPAPYTLCAGGAVCLSSSVGDSSICYTGGTQSQGNPCQTNLDCDDGNLCIGRDDLFLCHQACGIDEDCEADERCRMLDTGSRVCENKVGRKCTSSAECPDAEQSCTTEVDPDYLVALPGGLCTFTECEGTSCPEGSVCLRLPGAPGAVCMPDCDDDSDCRFTSGYRCRNAEQCPAFDDELGCRDAIGDSTVCLPF